MATRKKKQIEEVVEEVVEEVEEVVEELSAQHALARLRAAREEQRRLSRELAAAEKEIRDKYRISKEEVREFVKTSRKRGAPRASVVRGVKIPQRGAKGAFWAALMLATSDDFDAICPDFQGQSRKSLIDAACIVRMTDEEWATYATGKLAESMAELEYLLPPGKALAVVDAE